MDKNDILKKVNKGYGEIALGKTCGCACKSKEDSFAENLGYFQEDLAQLPKGANLGLSCGNPVNLAGLKEGQVVLDLGCGGGLDVFLAALKVKEKGRAIGVDMTPEMVFKARENIKLYTQKTGFENVEFRLGEIEYLPVADNSIDVLISNCVINLSPSKNKVWQEIYRVLKPKGQVFISDLALFKALPENIIKVAEKSVSCMAGAILIEETKKMALNIGFSSFEYTLNKEYVPNMVQNKNPLYTEVTGLLKANENLTDYLTSVNFILVK